MKIGKYWSIISIIIAVVLIAAKVQFDLSVYGIIKEAIEKYGDVNPSIVAGGMKLVIVCIVSLTFSIIGMRKQNDYRKLGLGLNIFTIIYLLIPVGFLLAVL